MWGFAGVILGLQRFMFWQIIDIHTSTMLSSYFSLINYSFCKLSLLLGVLRGPDHPMRFTLAECIVLLFYGVLGSGADTGFPLCIHMWFFFHPGSCLRPDALIPSQSHTLYSIAIPYFVLYRIHVSIGYIVACDDNFYACDSNRVFFTFYMYVFFSLGGPRFGDPGEMSRRVIIE